MDIEEIAGSESVKNHSRHTLVALVASFNTNNMSIIIQLQKIMNEKGRQFIFFDNHDNLNTEKKNFEKLQEFELSGLICIPENMNSHTLLNITDLPKVCVNGFTQHYNYLNFDVNYESASLAATQFLLEKSHTKIAFIKQKSEKIHTEKLLNGYIKALLKEEFEVIEQYVISEEDIGQIQRTSFDAVICENESIASAFYQYAADNGIEIPNQISVVCLTQEKGLKLSPTLTYFLPDEKAICQQAVAALIDQLEPHNQALTKDNSRLTVCSIFGDSVRCIDEKKKIVVVGSLSYDTLIKSQELPDSGKTVIAQSQMDSPGGKGTNQVIGLAKLGCNAYIIGCVGDDPQGHKIILALKEYGVKIEGIKIDKFGNKTGRSYIHVNSKGESSITLYPGANNKLTVQHIRKFVYLFEQTEYCLMQTDIPPDVVSYVLHHAYQKNVKVILKPSGIDYIDASLLEKVYIISPNKKEMEQLTPKNTTIEQKAQYFLDKGVKNVIFTLGKSGCYYKNLKESIFFEAAETVVRDTTGASDAFLSTLAMKLNEGYEIRDSIKTAVISAGICVSQEGIIPALADQMEISH